MSRAIRSAAWEEEEDATLARESWKSEEREKEASPRRLVKSIASAAPLRLST